MTLLLTGAAGFIGSALTRLLVKSDAGKVVALDRLGYAASLDALPPLVPGHPALGRPRLCRPAAGAGLGRKLINPMTFCSPKTP